MAEKRMREVDDDDDMEDADQNPFGMDLSGSQPMDQSASFLVQTPSQVGAAPAAGAAAAAAAAAPDIPPDLLSEDLRLLLESMDEFTPTIPEAVTTYFLNRSGFQTSDSRM